MHALTFFCLAAFTLLSAAAQSATGSTPDPAMAQAAVSFVLSQSSINPLAPVPATGKPLPANGHWSIDTARPTLCPQNDLPCVRVLYGVTDANVTCEWVVLLPSNGTDGTILDQNESASLFLIHKLSRSQAAPLVKIRVTPIYPPIARAAHVTGSIVVRVIVNSSGEVQNAVTVSGPEMLRATTLDAIRQWSFNRLLLGTHPAAFTTDIQASFVTMGPSSVSSVKVLP